MIPIGDTNIRGARTALITISLIVINVLVFLYQSTLNPQALAAFYDQFAVVPAEILQGEQLHTLLTSMFLHGGWLHLIANMLFLWVFGDNVEVSFGHFGYLLFYLAGGVVASAAHIAGNMESTVPSLGASGAIGAVLGAYIVMFPRSRVKALVFFIWIITVTRIRAVLFLGIWFIIQLFSGFASLGAESAQTGGVAFLAHVGGFAFGLLVGFIFRDRAGRLDFDERFVR